MSQVTFELDDPNVGTDREQLQAAADAHDAREAALRARIPQVKAIYPKLKARNATNAEIQGVLQFILLWLRVQDEE